MSHSASEYVPLAEAWRLFPHACGWRFSTSAIWGWVSRGVLIHGERVRLRAVRVGRKYFTTEQWADEFIREYVPSPAGAEEDAPPAGIPAPRERCRVRPHAEAEWALIEAGM